MKKIIYGTITLIVILVLNGCTSNDVSEEEHIKVFFSDNFKDENSIVQSYENWYSGSSEQQYSLKELYKDGWKTENITKINGSAQNWQMVFFMKIKDTNYNKVKLKYEKESNTKINKSVSPEKAL